MTRILVSMTWILVRMTTMFVGVTAKNLPSQLNPEALGAEAFAGLCGFRLRRGRLGATSALAHGFVHDYGAGY